VSEAGPLRPAKGHGPIFIIGAMGSGTTLLRLMLDSHEHIAIPHETGFMRAYKAMQFIPFKWTGYGWAYRLGWSKEEFDVELRRFFDRIFMRYVEQHGKQRWGEKTPLHAWHIDAIARVFPEAVFVGIVRHPGASTASNMTRFHHPVHKMCIHYNRYNKEIARQAARFPDRFVVLRYEELLLQTEPVMRELLDWLGEPWSDKVLEHHVVQGAREHARVEGKSVADEPIDTSRIDKWTRTMKPADRRVVKERLGQLGELFGYSMSDPGTLEPLNARGSLLAGGEDMHARIERFPDLDVPTRMPVPIFEHYYNPRRFWLVANETGEPPRRTPEPLRDGPPPKPAGSALRRAALPIARRLPAPARRRLRSAARRLTARSGRG
jgi:hypothetical protein